MSVGADFRRLVDDRRTTYEEVRAFLEGLTRRQRIGAIRAIGGARRQARLFALAKSGPEFTLEDMVSEERGPLRPLIYHGKNSMPAFSVFQKRFCWPSVEPSKGPRLLGYNHHTFGFATGPGYFRVRVAEPDEQALGPVAVDYTEVPTEKPAGWPEIRENDQGLSRFVYDKMVDYLRALCDGVFIGRAVRDGKVTNNYFILAREGS